MMLAGMLNVSGSSRAGHLWRQSMAELVPVWEEQLPAFAPAEVDAARPYRDA